MDAARIDRALERGVAEGLAPGVGAGVTDRTATLYTRALGRMGGSPGVEVAGRVSGPAQRPMTGRSIFRIASMTKLVTSVAVLMLVEEGRLELDAPLRRYLPSYRQPEVLVSLDRATRRYKTRPAASEPSIRQLLTHTAGYGYWWLDPELLAFVDGEPELMNPAFAMTDPGVRFAYSTSTDVLGQVFEPLTGLTLGAFFEQRIFAPLGMRDTGFGLPRELDRLVSVYRRDSTGLVELPRERTGNVPRGGGGLYSTVTDYLALLQMLLGGGEARGQRLLGVESVAAIGANQIGALFAVPQTTALPERSNDFIFMDGTQRFGFGVMVETRDRDVARSAGSFGWGGILNTYFWVDPKRELAAVIMMQLSPFADPACVNLARRFEAAVYGGVPSFESRA